MAIDYDAFLETLLSQNKITAEEHAEFLEDENALPNAVGNSNTVLSLGWDGETQGCSGGVWVISWKGFYFCTSSDYDDQGPFESIDQALELAPFYTVTPNPELGSDVLPLEKLLVVGRRLVNEHWDEIYINRKRYILKDGKLVKPNEAK